MTAGKAVVTAQQKAATLKAIEQAKAIAATLSKLQAAKSPEGRWGESWHSTSWICVLRLFLTSASVVCFSSFHLFIYRTNFSFLKCYSSVLNLLLVRTVVASSSSQQPTTATSATAATATAEDEERQRKQRLKDIVDGIPTDPARLFAHPVDWAAVEAHKVVDGTMRAWTLKKMKEYLGEEERTLTEFILAKLHRRCAPGELLTELAAVLDEDAQPFCVKLWRMLIYSAATAAAEGCSGADKS